MKKTALIFIFLFSFTLSAQTINGIVTDVNKNPIALANVYLEGTYDGATTNDKGEFSFKTTEKGTQNLIVSFVGFETYTMLGAISYMKDLKIQLREDINSLDAVILSAGTFSAGDNSKVNVLKPLDVVTTASALGDFVGALQTLPGTTTVAEDGRLFVRGGEAEETQIFIDGIKVFTPYSPTTNDTPTRGRYSPFLFDGITFSTGGYSAEYGQALSSVLLLNTTGEPDQEKTDISIMSVGLGLGNTQKWENNSLSVNASYINLAPYNAIFKGRNEWIKPVEAASGEAVFRQKTNNGMLKLYTAFDASRFELIQEDINNPDGVSIKLNNNNLYFNGSYKGMLGDSWTLQTGMSYTNANNKIKVDASDINDTQNSFHGKVKLKHKFNNRFKLNFGAEYLATDFNENYEDNSIPSVDYGFNNNISAAFTEADIFFSKNLALKAGLRLEYSALFDAITLSPRVSMAYKISEKSQVSLAYGDFYQNPNSDILKFETNLQAQHTSHYILNYQYNNNKQIFRAEAYLKDYTDLVKYDSEFVSFDANYNNQGKGFAKGIDLFWRDNNNIKNVDYWVSYSLLDSERDYKNYPNAAQPNFANTHNLSVVGKYWIDNWKSQVGLSYAFASGRTYTNPNETGFLNATTKSYNNLSLNWAYLLSPQKILYLSVNNVLGFKNVNGYQYANTPDINGNFASRSLRPATDQFFFVGFFWTISEKGNDNQLNNL
ncbi:TonB-dependent receptor [Oceanihabitans sp. 2_MG-2023]|uniref:TonB-dependent receptor n=1 Tax=Oceanihabitans sp. 2_MG-2023 TaxID=3062661 RepID=UPI0026E258A6|nr:TonB-dependent receptor [Oceanihabitans sp. 2_MG-2023]MDO6597103.1 TonB-dependent receptor [Oceanihabitans sp. 2_MG-2023]